MQNFWEQTRRIMGYVEMANRRLSLVDLVSIISAMDGACIK